MVKLILIFEDEDPTMGAYFRECAVHIKAALNGLRTELYEINGNNLNTAYIDLTIKKLNGTKFLCLVYSHGDRKSFGFRQTFIVEGETQKFSNSFFYTFSCHTGNEVGKDIVRNGGISFWGYVSEACYVIGYRDIFVECANYGIIKMIEGETSSAAYLAMKNNYNDQIDQLYKPNFFTASVLMENRDGMILHGKDVKLEEFIVA